MIVCVAVAIDNILVCVYDCRSSSSAITISSKTRASLWNLIAGYQWRPLSLSKIPTLLRCRWSCSLLLLLKRLRKRNNLSCTFDTVFVICLICRCQYLKGRIWNNRLPCVKKVLALHFDIYLVALSVKCNISHFASCVVSCSFVVAYLVLFKILNKFLVIIEAHDSWVITSASIYWMYIWHLFILM